ncbi:hypothetical protein ABZN20_12155 [Methylococcus sp. ANG]|uniref:hypothetical protein n=1 Tax=Methylococcus sp. ANG TaxID=3231903 RepID=UPI00345ACA5C
MSSECLNRSAYPVSKISNLLKAKYGLGNVRITEDGAIYVFAVQANEIAQRWLLFGDMGAADTEARLDALAAEYGEEEAA